MSKAKTRWERVFGLPRSRWEGRDPARRPLPADCDVVITPFALRKAGFTNVHRGLRALEADNRFHRWEVILPDGRRVQATHPTSLSWLAETQYAENRERSLGNLKVGDQVLETIVKQGSEAPFVPEIWRVPVAPPAPRPSAPLREARPQAGRAVAVVWNERELDSALLDLLYSDALRLLNATDAPLRRGDLAAELRLEHSKEDRLALAKVIYRLKAEGYHVAP